jgi:hypothetical protein
MAPTWAGLPQVGTAPERMRAAAYRSPGSAQHREAALDTRCSRLSAGSVWQGGLAGVVAGDGADPSGRYCGHCTDETGQLQAFEERFERMAAWQARRSPDTPREEIERQTLEYMATMPAWRDHPRVASRAG